jgi:hypothetical protein
VHRANGWFSNPGTFAGRYRGRTAQSLDQGEATSTAAYEAAAARRPRLQAHVRTTPS